MRDIDVFIGREVDKDEKGGIIEGVRSATEGHLKVDVFGIDKHEQELGRVERVGRTLSEWLSRRTIDAATGKQYYELYPLIAEVDPASYMPWKLYANGADNGVSVLHPVGHALAYGMRSISGPRPKDGPKVAEMKAQLANEAEFSPDNTPQFDNWRRFGVTIETTLAGRRPPRDLARPETGLADLKAFRVKGHALGAVERNGGVVKFAQDGIGEKILKPFVRSK